ncbi:MAG: hypothetical protein AAGJ91_03300 [Pseudomonadota bacterium]
MRSHLALCALLLPGFAWALPSAPAERAELFARCAGSFAAEAEHLRLMGGDALPQVEETERMFSLLLDATVTGEMRTGDTAIALRVARAEARLIQRELLTAATFAVHRTHRDPARHAAERRLSLCQKLLLGS